MSIPIIGGFIDKVRGKSSAMENITTPEILPPPDFTRINDPSFSESHYRSIERMGQIESKPDMLKAIEDSEMSRQAKDGWIMFIKNEYDSNMMYSNLTEGNNFDIAHYMMLINLMVCTVGNAYKSDRRKDMFSSLTSSVTNQTWRRDTRAVGIDSERKMAAAIEFKYSSSKRSEGEQKK